MPRSADDVDDEDTTDEHYLAAHDAVLCNMREKWALLSRLKQEVRRDSSSINPPRRSTGGYKGDYESSRALKQGDESTARTSNDSVGNASLVYPPENPVKKRGRPPKHHKAVHFPSRPST